MSLSRFFRALGFALAFVAVLRAQSLDRSIPLDDGNPAVPDLGFGIAVAPDGTHAYATIAGDVFGPNNNHVAIVDILAGAQTGIGQTQQYPEDPAITLDPQGAPRNVYVTNSTSGSVTCLTPLLGPVATIPLPSCFGGSSYPFGVLMSPDQTRLYVSTIGGCGDIDVIDTDPASPTFNTVVSSFTVANGGGRPSWWTYPIMVVPTTTYDAGFTLSRGGFAVVDVSSPASLTSYPVSPPLLNHYSSATECVVIPGGRVLVSVGYEVFPTVYECDLATGAITRTLNLNAIAGVALHGLAVNAEGTVGAVTSINGGETVFFDVATFAVTGVHSHGSTAKPNDVAFTPDGSRAVVSLQGAARVDVLKQVPGYALELAAPAAVAIGGNLTFAVDDCEAGQPWALYYSLAGAGPQTFGPYTVLLSSPFDLAHQGFGDVHGDASVTFVVPALAGLPGMTVSTQAVTIDRDGSIRLSNGAQTSIN